MAKKNPGIQPGYTAATCGSQRLDTRIRLAIKQTLEQPEFAPFGWMRKMPKHLLPANVGACQPDGGILLLDDLLVFALEGKTQRRRGNAIERYSKNRNILAYVSPALTYVTLCAGDGTDEGAPIDVFGRQVMAIETGDPDWNIAKLCTASFFKVNAHISVAQIKAILRPILRSILDHRNSIRATDEKFREQNAARVAHIRSIQIPLAEAAD